MWCIFTVIRLACFALGLSILITLLAKGSFPVGPTKELRGGAGYAAAVLLMTIEPVAFIFSFTFGYVHALRQVEAGPEHRLAMMLVELGIIPVCAVPAGIIAAAGAKPKKHKKKKKRLADEDDDYDAPARRHRRDEEEDQDGPPRHRRFDWDGGGSQHRRRRLDEDED